jgi:HEAT repeat protein
MVLPQDSRSEKELVALLFLLGFLAVGVTSVFTSTAANTLFLTSYDASSLAYSYLGFAMITPLVGTCYLRMQVRWGLQRLIIAALAADAVLLLCFRVGFFLGWDRVFSFALKVWYDAELVLMSIVFWGLANQLLTVRQGKRLFGIIGAGDPVALIIGGAATPLLLTWLSPADLLMLSALGAAAAIAVVWIILDRHKRPDDTTDKSDEDAPSEGSRSLSRDRYVLLIFAAACLSLFCYFLVDNAFYAEAKQRFPQEADLARFIGIYMAVAGAVSLLSAVAITGPVVSRFGVRIGLLMLPSALLVFSILAIASAGLRDGAAILFGCVVANRVFDFGLRGTVDKSSALATYQPFSATRRLRVQTAVETMVEPFAAAVSGLGLLLVMNVFGWRAAELTVLVACIAAVWICSLVFVHRHYVLELGRALATRRFGPVLLETGEHTAVIEKGLLSPRAGEVIYCLHLLTSSGRILAADRLLELLDHPSADVRLAAAEAMNQRANPAFVEPIRHHLRNAEEPKVSSALLSAWLASAPGAVEEVALFLDENGPLRNGAMIALFRHGGMEGILLAGEYLLEAIRSKEPNERQRAAMVLATVGSPLFHRLLSRLLDDPDLSVRKAALKAASRMDASGLWPIVLAQLNIPELERAAQAALVAAGERCFPAIDAALPQPDLPARVRLRLMEVLSRIGGPKAQARLLAQTEPTEWRMRLAMHAALRGCDCGCPPAVEKLLWQQIDALAETAAWVTTAAEDLPPGQAHFDMLRRGLNHEVDKSIAGIFHLLACLSPPRAIEDARESLLHGPIHKRAYALEAIEQTLPTEIRARVMALLEPVSTEERRRTLNRYFPHPSLPLEARLADILSTNNRIGPWTASVTLFATTKSDIRLTFDRAVLSRRFDEDVVHEILAWMDSSTQVAARAQTGSGID